MSKSDYLKSPFENMMHIIPQSDGKAFRKAFYNSIAIVFVVFVLAVGVGVYFILQAFLKPLLWAILVGTCLHPFKYTLTEYTRQWFLSMDSSGKPLIVSAITLPIQLLDAIAEFTIQKIIKYSKLLLFIFFGLPFSYIIYHYGPLSMIINGFTACLTFLSETIGIFSTYWVVSIIVGYVCMVLFYWRPHTSCWLKPLSIPIWCIIIVYLAAISGPFRVPLFLSLIFLMLTGAITYAKDHNTTLFSWSHLGVVWEFITRPRGRSNSLANIVSEEDSSELPDDHLEEDVDEDIENGDMEFQTGEQLDSSSDLLDPMSQTADTPIRPSSLAAEKSSTPDNVDVVDSPTDDRISSGDILKSKHEDPTSEIEKIVSSHSDTSTKDDPSSSSSWSAIINWCNHLFSRDVTDSMPAQSPSGERPSLRRSRSQPASSPFYSSAQSGYTPSYPGLHQSNSRKGTVKRAFIVLLWAHVLVYSWSHLWIVQLMPVLSLMVLLKKMVNKVHSMESVQWFLGSAVTNIETVLGDRKDALAPIPVRGILKLIFRGDKKIRHFLSASLDSLVSISVILGVIIGTIFFTGFLAFQIHRESIHFVTMTSSVLNDTMHSELSNWLPEREYLKNLFDSMMDNAYVFGREWISKKIDQVLDTNSYNKARIEEQVLELWDKLYHRIISKNDSLSNVSDILQLPLKSPLSAVPHLNRQNSLTLENLWQTLSSFEVLDLQQIITFIKENLGLLSTVLESVWLLLRSNLNLCLSLITAVFSLIFGGGTVVLNFIVSLLIFLSTLFYLLAFSGESYLPVQFITSLTPAVDNNPTIRRFYSAVEAAINGVFEATVKMAVFYGFYTVLTHTIFGVNLVVIPAVMAASFGAIPFLGTYWAALPAVMELLLVHNELGLAITLFVLHLLPTYFLDTAIYSEIKGAGHPYMTGLAIAGGVYCLGLEGAIVGPILLCFLLVGVNFYGNMLAPGRNTPTTSSGKGGDHTDGTTKSKQRYGRKVQFNAMSSSITF